MQFNHVVVWIDHAEAHLIGFNREESESSVVKSGLADGDKLLRHPVATLKDGQAVKDTPSAAASAEAPAKP